MARKKIPDENLSPEQRKRRERNEKYRLKAKETVSQNLFYMDKKKALRQPKNLSQIPSQIDRRSQSKSLVRESDRGVLQHSLSQVKSQMAIKMTSPEIFNNEHSQPSPLSQNLSQNLSQIGSQTMTQNQSQISNETQKVVSLKVSNPGSQISSRWESLFNLAAHPEYLLSMIPVLILSAYLTYQNYLFFEKIESSSFVASINACISELVLIILAASLAFSSKKTHKFFLSLFLISTIVGLGSFFHGAISDVLSEKSKEKEFITKAINVHLSSIEALPASYVSRRQELQKKIDDERAKLTKLDSTNDHATNSSISNTTSKISYAFWIRFVAMILNAYLVHCLFSRLKHTGCFDH